MGRIQLLESNMINKIAAGEVVERPLSVVKELVENSIDAGSTMITVEIKDGGTSFIRITDNGIGIPKEQVKSAFLRHATSKIENLNDLENVLTLGFRGEALSSIASVSQVEMITKTAAEITGYRIEINGGEVTAEHEAGSTDGTSIVVRNLFYNTPARRKFLKKPATESGYISDIVNKIAIGHPQISFKYINNSSIILQTKGNNDLKTTIFQVYGKDAAKNMIELQYSKPDFTLNGFIGKPNLNRGNRTYENFFINGRYVKSDLIQSAAEEAYKTKLPIGKFPFYVLNLTIHPTTVDVNVHPTKLEVRFSDEEKVYQYVVESVERTLKSEILIPEAKWSNEKPPQFSEVVKNGNYVIEDKQKNITDLILETQPIREEISKTAASELFEKSSLINEVDLPYKIEDTQECDYRTQKKESLADRLYSKKTQPYSTEEITNTEKYIFRNYKIIGQIFNTYWIVEQDNKMYIIDQHAAHERALYEDITNQLKNNKIVSQKLLQPIAIHLSETEKRLVNENKELFDRSGFDIEDFGVDAIALRAVPFLFDQPADQGFFIEILDKLASVTTSVSNIYETKIHTIATISCKAAVKGNDKLSYPEAKALIEKIMTLENPFTCPHGRPTIIEMSKYELEKRFIRIQ